MRSPARVVEQTGGHLRPAGVVHTDEQHAGECARGLFSHGRLLHPAGRGSVVEEVLALLGKYRRSASETYTNPTRTGNLDQRATTPGQCLSRGGAERRDRHSDGQFEIVARRGEPQCGGARVAQLEPSANKVAAGPHDREIGQQG